MRIKLSHFRRSCTENLVVLLAFLTLFLLLCANNNPSDQDEKPGSNTILDVEDVTGCWKQVSFSGLNGKGDWVDAYELLNIPDELFFVFHFDNGTFDFSNCRGYWDKGGEWKIKGDMLTLFDEDGDEYLQARCSLSDKELYLYYDMDGFERIAKRQNSKVEEKDSVRLVLKRSSSACEALTNKPAITGQPSDTTAMEGDTVFFEVETDGADVHYLWQKNAKDISESDSSVYSVIVSGSADSARFRCIVSNPAGSDTSSAAMLLVEKKVVNIGEPWIPSEVSERRSGQVKIIAAGHSFLMGSDDGGIASPAHIVSFTSDFYMDTAEVTQKSYTDVMSNAFTTFKAPQWSPDAGNKNPAYDMTWCDAVLYCNERSKRDGFDTVYSYTSISGIPGNGADLGEVSCDFTAYGYRLPTEAEWEYACRGGTSTPAYWGDSNADDYVWHSANTQAAFTGVASSQPVARKLPNKYGLYDMIGNVEEWCNDWYAAYTDKEVTDPRGPSEGDLRIRRGGSWNSGSVNFDCTKRSALPADESEFTCGFRVVLPVGSSLQSDSSITILLHPKSVTAGTGTSVTFKVKASGYALNYQWTSDGKNIKGANSETYILNEIKADDSAKIFRCIVSNATDTVSSDKAVLTVVGVPSVVTHPSDVRVTEGQEVTFVVAANTFISHYQWLCNGELIPDTEDSTYTIETVTLTEHGNTYRCIISNVSGSDTSKAAVMTVDSKGGQWTVTNNVSEGNTLTDPDGNVYTTVQIGNQEWTVENLRTTKYNDGSGIHLDKSSAGTNMTWWNITTGSYCYYLYITTAADRERYGALYNWYAVSSRKLTPASGGWRIPTPEDVSVLNEYLGELPGKKLKSEIDWGRETVDSVTNSSGFTGLPGGFRYNEDITSPYPSKGSIAMWWTSGEVDDKTAKDFELNSGNDDIQNRNINKRFGCSIRLVRDWDLAPPKIVKHPADTSGNEGTDMQFSVDANGHNLSYQWQMNDSNISGATDSYYIVRDVTVANDSSAYRCIVSNEAGRDTSNYALLIIEYLPPVITGSPIDLAVTEGDSAQFSITATGTALAYQWQVNDTNITDASLPVLTVDQATLSNDGNMYRCIVYNKVDTVRSTPVKLTVNHTVPVITKHPVSRMVTSGESVTFKVAAAGSDLSYQWFCGGAVVDGADSPNYTSGSNDTASIYRCIVSNVAGSDTSNDAGVIISGSSVADVEGNIYKTIIIGTQEWTVENLRTKVFNDGTPIPLGSDRDTSMDAAYEFYERTSDTAEQRKWGALYNWHAVATGKLAPEGWRVPSLDDWLKMEAFFGTHGYDADPTKSAYVIGKCLADTSEWSTVDEFSGIHIDVRDGHVGYAQEKNNTSGFSALPAGLCSSGGMNFKGKNEAACWWTSTEDDEANAQYLYLRTASFTVVKGPYYKYIHCSVRLVRDL